VGSVRHLVVTRGEASPPCRPLGAALRTFFFNGVEDWEPDSELERLPSVQGPGFDSQCCNKQKEILRGVVVHLSFGDKWPGPHPIFATGSWANYFTSLYLHFFMELITVSDN
jgi:hypothetical protein